MSDDRREYRVRAFAPMALNPLREVVLRPADGTEQAAVSARFDAEDTARRMRAEQTGAIQVEIDVWVPPLRCWKLHEHSHFTRLGRWIIARAVRPYEGGSFNASHLVQVEA